MIKAEKPITLSRKTIQQYRKFNHFNHVDTKDAAEIAKLNVITALTPKPYTINEVFRAVGRANSPNAVSRALRNKLPPRRI